MEEIRSKQRELLEEWGEMNQGVSLLGKGTGVLNDLSERNSRSASTLNEEIKKLGS